MNAHTIRFPARIPPQKIDECRACGDHFRPLKPWYFWCSQCYRGAALYQALVRYREAPP